MYSNSAVDRCLQMFLSQRKERESNPQGLSYKLGRLPTGSRRLSVCPSIFCLSSSTRNRTWNFSLEARDDVRFTIEPCRLRQSVEPTKRKARELNPHNFYVALFSKQARRTVSGYLPYRGSFENRTRSSFLPRTRAPGTLTNQKVVGTHRCTATKADGRTESACYFPVIAEGIEPSVSCVSCRCLSRWTTRSSNKVVETGVEPAKSLGSRPSRFSGLRTQPI